MASVAFQASSANQLTAQPAAAGEKLVIRSDNAADTMNLSVSGLVAAVSTTETDALLGKRELQTTALFQSLTQLKLASAAAGTVRVYGQGVVGCSGLVVVSTQPANNDTLRVGLTGFQQTYTFKTTLTGAANEIKIGATASDTAANISAALNAGAGAGTTYGTGTAANAFVSATVVGTIVTIVNKIAAARQLAWAIDQGTGATLSITAPSGGSDGALLAIINAGVTQLYNSFELSSEDLAHTTLPAAVVPTTDPVTIGGGSCTLRFKCANVTSAITLKYQTSTDGINWSEPLTTGISLDDNTVANPLYVIPAERNISLLRLVFTANANTTDTALDARVIY